MLGPNPTVFVVDPDASTRASLEAAIRRGGWAPEGLASADPFLARQPPTHPSCLVMELALADVAGFDVLRRVIAEAPGTPVIVLTGPHDIPATVLAMKAGAAEVLTKPLAREALQEAVGHALADSRAVLARQADLAELRRRHAALSGRERQVMARVVAGHLNKRIAAALGISEITVKAHRGRVMCKMGAVSLPGLVIMALRLGLPHGPGTATPPVDARVPSERTDGLARRGTDGECTPVVGRAEPRRDGHRLRPRAAETTGRDNAPRRWGSHGAAASAHSGSRHLPRPAGHGGHRL